MNPNLTEIAYILDRSGSMERLQEAAISGFNEFLQGQLDTPGDARLTLVLFDNEYLVPFAARPLEEVGQIDARTYVPRGSTALLDAIGETIDGLGQRLAATPEADRPGKVVVAVFTDGLENSSRRFTWHEISDRIQHQRDKYGWEFLFLGANQDAVATASQMKMEVRLSSGMRSSAAGVRGANLAASRKVSALRRSAMGMRSADVDVPMSRLVEEETRAAENGENQKSKPSSSSEPPRGSGGRKSKPGK